MIMNHVTTHFLGAVSMSFLRRNRRNLLQEEKACLYAQISGQWVSKKPQTAGDRKRVLLQREALVVMIASSDRRDAPTGALNQMTS